MNIKFTKLILIIIFSQNIFASELKIAEFSSKCSALFLLMTMPQEEQLKPFTDNIANLSETMNLIAGVSYEMSGEDLNNGQVLNRRNIEADKLIKIYKRNPKDVLSLYARCDKFREDFAYAAMQNPENELKIINSLSVPDVITMTDQKTGIIEMILDLSFQEMDAAGIDSIVELYKTFRN